MKVYHLIENLDDSYGGPAKSIPYLVKELKKLNVWGKIISTKFHRNETNEIVNKYNLSWSSFSRNFPKKINYSKDLKKYLSTTIKIEKNILFHTHNLWNFIPYIAYWLSKKYQIPLVSSLRGSIRLNKLRKIVAWNLFQKKIFQSSKVVHVTNKKDISILKKLGVNSSIAYIPNGVDIDEFKSMGDPYISKKNLGLKENKKYILFLSRVHRHKGLHFLVNSWIKIAKKYSDWDLLIVGPTYNEKYLKAISSVINQNKLKDRVHIKGFLSGTNKIDCLNASNLFVLPSYSENFGNIIAEAMAAKLPVLTTQGTPWEEIEKFNTGWWVPLCQKNIDNALCEALACGEIELEKKGANGFKLIQNYKIQDQAKKMKQVYAWILNNKIKPDFIY